MTVAPGTRQLSSTAFSSARHDAAEHAGPEHLQEALVVAQAQDHGVARPHAAALQCAEQADRALAPAIADLGLRVLVTGTVMGGADDRRRLAAEVLAAAVDA